MRWTDNSADWIASKKKHLFFLASKLFLTPTLWLDYSFYSWLNTAQGKPKQNSVYATLGCRTLQKGHFQHNRVVTLINS